MFGSSIRAIKKSRANVSRSVVSIVPGVRSWRTATVNFVKDVRARLSMAFTRRRPNSSPGAATCKHILIVDDLLPDPLFGAGYPRAFAIVRSLVKAGHRVSFYPMQSNRSDLARMTAGFSGAVAFHVGEGPRGLRRLLWKRGHLFDLLFISRPVPLQAWHDALDTRSRRQTTPIIYDAEAVVTPREALRLALLGQTMSNPEYRSALDQELRLAQRADLITTVSRRDGDTIASALDIPVIVVPHAVPVTSGGTAFECRQDFLFVGRLTGSATSSPNVDSVVWFVRQVMPILDVMLGLSYMLHVAGCVDTPELDDLQNDRILFHGVVEELGPLYDRCRVFIAPTRFAAGIPLKVVEAMGRGIPCVATPLLADQLGAGENALLTGASPREFAQACNRLYTEAQTWNDIRRSGRAYVERDYSDRIFDDALARAIAGVVGPHCVRGSETAR